MGTGREEHSTEGWRCLPEFGRSWLPLAAVALCLPVAVGYCMAKRDYYLDEIWSYGYANSHYAPFLSDVAGGDLAGATLTRRDLLDYVSVGEGERMDVGSVLHNQALDLHPPLFGLALNAASSLAPGTWSKWAGLGLNLACHAVAASSAAPPPPAPAGWPSGDSAARGSPTCSTSGCTRCSRPSRSCSPSSSRP